MTVLQMRDTDEGNQLPQKKRRLSSRPFKDDTRQSVEAWLTAVKSESTSRSSPVKTETNPLLSPVKTETNPLLSPAKTETNPLLSPVTTESNPWLSPGKIESSPFQMPAGLDSDTMVNYGLNDPYHQNPLQKPSEENGYCELGPVASLLNVGNTCFLNSVLYTLRYAPSFLHKLHHLNHASELVIKQAQANKDRSYSLGRIGKNSSYWKDSSYGPSYSEIKTQAAINKLHQVYMSLCLSEMKDRVDPFQPNFFLHALREVNPIFEGNQQHDAHELLVCIIDMLREACELVFQQNNHVDKITPPPPASSTSSAFKSVMRKSLKIGKIIRPDKRTTSLRENHSEGDFKKYLINGDSGSKDDGNILYPEDRLNSTQNTLFDDFRGVSSLLTTCLECEQVTERKETFCDICVPIETIKNHDEEEAVDQLYRSIIVTEEYLMDCNKYWCEKCSRYNEAKRCVKFEKLPRLLTLHLKRFSSGFGSSVSKVNDHMPTPLSLSCFCNACLETSGSENRPHHYTLYAIIMHIGPTIASGHYVAYVKQTDPTPDYKFCTKDKPKTSSLSRGSSISSVASNSGHNMQDKSVGLTKYFRSLSSKSFNGSSGNTNAGREVDAKNRVVSSCKGIDCCSIRRREMDDSEQTWLECDDESVRPLSTEELVAMLSPGSTKNVSVTPYLLFYSRVES